MENVEVARIFDEVADLLEILGANVFRVRAYRTAARTVETHGGSVAQLAASDPEALAELPGIGKDLAGKIVEIIETGTLELLTELLSKVPEGLARMMRVANVGPKRAKLFYDRLGLHSVADLAAAAEKGQLHELKGVGETLEKRILQGCHEEQARSTRIRLDEADAHAAAIVEHLRSGNLATEVSTAGSLRRRRDTVGDLDLLAATKHPQKLADRFVAYAGVKDVLAHGDTRCSVVLRSGLQVDLRIVPPECFGAALVYLTGSKAHGIALRTLALKRDLKISEYGVFRGERRIAGRTEEDVYRTVDLPWIAPELREDRGELAAAAAHALPDLVKLSDVRGDLHVHTTESDGHATLSEMVLAAKARGYAYVAITDHTPAVRVTGGLDRARFREQARAIEKLRSEIPGIAILHGAEVDILDDGSLDLDDATLGELDWVVASVHSKFGMPARQMTERVLRALRHPAVSAFGHPNGRLLGQREPYAIDMERVVREARDLGVLLEVNGQPQRLDLTDLQIRMARDAGARLVIDTDAHRTSELDFMRFGVDQARRGWCTADDVANTRSLSAFRKLARPRVPASASAAGAGRPRPERRSRVAARSP